MSGSLPNRRDIHRLAAAALGGLLTGALAGCGGRPPDKPGDNVESRLLQDPHVCRGLNTCKDKGKKGTTNDCAGQGHCATVADHGCDGTNDCKGQGGCGEHPGENVCKGRGRCQTPLKAKTWAIARPHFEELMKKAGRKFGDAPES